MTTVGVSFLLAATILQLAGPPRAPRTRASRWAHRRATRTGLLVRHRDPDGRRAGAVQPERRAGYEGHRRLLGLRAVFGTRSRLGSELAYVGSMRALTAGGQAALVSHSVEASCA